MTFAKSFIDTYLITRVIPHHITSLPILKGRKSHKNECHVWVEGGMYILNTT